MVGCREREEAGEDISYMEKVMKKYVPMVQVLLFLFMLVFLIHYFRNKRDWQDIAREMGVQTEEGAYGQIVNGREESLDSEGEVEMEPSELSDQPVAAGQLELPNQPVAVGQSELPDQQAAVIQEENIYSFLQGPQSWNEGIPWSGEWCKFEVDGNSFGSFGCGICCMANVYNTLSPYEISPWDMYGHAKIASGYTPGGGYGAIDWQDMRCALEVCGISSELHRKPNAYEDFQEQIRGAKSAIVLVCSGNDNSFWQATQGHYVNIWLYQEDGTVFLAEPGNREKNRSRIPLRYVYDALKTGSSFQYLVVKDYVEADNMWRADGIEENWCRPGS